MTNELKEKLLAYGTKAEPFTVHNHIRVTDLQDGEARTAGGRPTAASCLP